jgi:hypothetical protein
MMYPQRGGGSSHFSMRSIPDARPYRRGDPEDMKTLVVLNDPAYGTERS